MISIAKYYWNHHFKIFQINRKQSDFNKSALPFERFKVEPFNSQGRLFKTGNLQSVNFVRFGWA